MVESKKHPLLEMLVNSDGTVVDRKLTENSKGYLQITYECKKYLVARLVYETFHNIILKKEEQIDHIDRNKKNNMIENLRLVNNMQNQYNTCKNRNFIANYNNETYISNAISYFARKFNLPNPNITKALNKEIKHVNGWVFIDIDDEEKYNFLLKKYIKNSDDIIIVKNITCENLKIENIYQARFDKIIKATNLLTKEQYIFSNISYFCKAFCVTPSNAKKVLNGERKKANNFTFETTSEFENLKIKQDEIIKL